MIIQITKASAPAITALRKFPAFMKSSPAEPSMRPQLEASGDRVLRGARTSHAVSSRR